MQTPAFSTQNGKEAVLTYKSAHRVSALETFNALVSHSVKTVNLSSAIASDPQFQIPSAYNSSYKKCTISIDCFAALLVSDGINIWQLATTLISFGNLTGQTGIQIDGVVIPGSFSFQNNIIPFNYVPSLIDVSSTELLMSAWPSFTNAVFGIGAGPIHRVQLSYNIKCTLSNE